MRSVDPRPAQSRPPRQLTRFGDSDFRFAILLLRTVDFPQLAGRIPQESICLVLAHLFKQTGMSSLPRLAIGTIQEDADSQAVLIALLDTLHRDGIQTQCFAAQASLPGQWAAQAITGLPGRYLDSWIMSRGLCRDLLLRSMTGADLAVVVGRFEARPDEHLVGGSLNTLCQWLDLPRLAVVDVALIDRRGLPKRPNVDAVFLDHVPHRRTLDGMITDIETLWGLPVVGALENTESARNRIASLAPGSSIPKDLCEQLVAGSRVHWRPDLFARLVGGAAALSVDSPWEIHDLPAWKPTIAVAYDEAFFGYFPSALDQLELLGAQVVDFSPLYDENLPPGTEIVYLGCGRPESFARALAENHCMKSALRSHVACGGRIYGEAGGAAYLSQAIEFPNGETQRMCGILPAVARFRPGNPASEPAEVVVAQDNWLVPHGTRLRGYRSGPWRFEALGCRLDARQKSCCQPDLIGCHGVVGSLIHLHFAAFPEILQSFFRRPLASSPLLDPWQIAS